VAQKPKLTFQDLKAAVTTEQYYNFPNKFGKEGEDHFNIADNADSFIGKLMSPGYTKTISYPYLGEFASVASLGYWVKDSERSELLRKLAGPKLKHFVNVNRKEIGHFPNFKAVIGYGTWVKLQGYPYIVKQLKELDTDKVKFLAYTKVEDSGIRMTHKSAEMYIQIANEIVKAIKEERQPNFHHLAGKGHDMSLYYVKEIIRELCGDDKVEELITSEINKVLESVKEEPVVKSERPKKKTTPKKKTGNVQVEARESVRDLTNVQAEVSLPETVTEEATA
jgi:hypothetical protein